MAMSSASEVIDLTALSDSSSDTDDYQQRHPHRVATSDEDDDQSSDSAYEITLDEDTRTRLHEAISTVNAERLRTIVHTLANTVPAAEEVLIQNLITLKRKSRDEEEEGCRTVAQNGAMLVVSRWELCGNCNEEFDVADKREDNECVFHPGELECNYDADGWGDWDENCHGPYDTEENRGAYPENFDWSCCSADGSGGGCVKGKHRTARKKRRM